MSALKNKLYTCFCQYFIGEECDRNGNPLSNQTPSSPPSTADPHDEWAPFESCNAFDLAHFFFKEDQTSAPKIDRFLQIMANSLEVHNDRPPFTSHTDVYRTIDEIPIGGEPWQSSTFTYDGPKPEDAPKWMDAEYTVWFRDPHQLFLHMVKNSEFKDSFDYAPYRQYDKNGDRLYEHFMSGDWAWQQAVCGFPLPELVF